MKTKNIIRILAAVAFTAGITTTVSRAAETEDKITMDKVPAAVQDAVKAYGTGDQIKGIENSDADGTKVIEFDIEKDGKSSEVAFRPDGRLFSTEGEVALSDLPAAVQDAITKKSSDAKAGAPEKVVQEGKVSYEVVFEKDGKKTEYTFSPEGKIVDSEEASKD